MSAHETYLDTSTIVGPSDRKFGLTLGALLLALAIWRYYLGSSASVYGPLAGAGAVLASLGAAAPSMLTRANRAWFKLGLLLAAVMTPLIMLVIFAAVFVPFALVMRARGRDQLALRPKPAGASYWIERDPAGADPSTMIHQF